MATDINRAIEITISVCRNEWKYVATLETDLDPYLPAVTCLPGEINQVLLNLIVNAAQAIEPADEGVKGSIHISTRRDGDWVEVRVRDTGAGIPEPIRHKIFNPFFTTKPVGGGTGQGLAISRDMVVNKHGGEMFFESEVGQGTTFTVRLPIDARETT